MKIGLFLLLLVLLTSTNTLSQQRSRRTNGRYDHLNRMEINSRMAPDPHRIMIDLPRGGQSVQNFDEVHDETKPVQARREEIQPITVVNENAQVTEIGIKFEENEKLKPDFDELDYESQNSNDETYDDDNELTGAERDNERKSSVIASIPEVYGSKLFY